MSPSPLNTREGVGDISEDAGSDIRVERLKLDVISKKAKGLDARVEGSLVDGRIELSMQEAPSLTLTLLDPDDELLLSGMFDFRIDSELDRVPFRLVTVARQEDGTLDLGFEHRVVAYLRAHTRRRKASRSKMTRAEFAKSLVTEVRETRIRFVSPDLHKRQPIEKATDRPTKAQKRANAEAGIADGKKIAVRGKDLTRGQVTNAERVLDTAASQNAGPKATLALVEACIVEAPDFKNPTGGDADSVGILQLRSSHMGGSVSTNGGRRDIEAVCKLFLTAGFTGRGGAIELAKENPTWSAGRIAQAVQGSAFPARYDQVKEDAQRVIAAYEGGGDSFGGGGQYWKRYEFSRGQNGKREDSWSALGRLAEEVRWRRFVVGRQTLYFASDDQLMRARPRYIIDRETPGIQGVSFELEVGGRAVVVKGRRERKPSEMVIRARMDRWAAPPGTVVEIADYGPADGRWLVDSVSRGVFDAEGEIRLRAPQKALPEPRPERGNHQQDTSLANGDAVDRVYSKAFQITQRDVPYGPGGHGSNWADAEKASTMDCSSSTSVALHAGGCFKSDVKGPQVSDYFLTWGELGEGEEMTVWVKPGSGPNGHVFIEFKGRKSARFDTSPQGDGGRGPKLRDTMRTQSGFTARHWPGT